jgi:hypothetical protein
MAIDARIPLAIQVPQTSQAINIFENALMNSQTRDLRGQQEERAKALAPFQQQQAQQGIDINQQALNENRDKQRLLGIHQTGQRLKPFLDAGDTQGAQNFLLDNISSIQSRIEAGEDLDVTESMETLAKLQAGDAQGVLTDINSVAGLVMGNKGTSAGQREFTNLLNIAQNPNSTDIERDSANRALGNLAKVGTSAAERIADSPELTQKVATSQAEIAGTKASATESEKLKQQRKHKPAITALVKLAEKEATERGETITALQRSQAALPGLTEAVGQLKELSQLATSTFGGKVFDFAVKQTGFGSTEGATSRAKFIAIVNNQVLPLLKETFGAAFTATEGESLKATMGDPDASPEEKMAQLDAFIAQKKRDIQTKERQLSQTQDLSTGEFVGFKVVR